MRTQTKTGIKPRVDARRAGCKFRIAAIVLGGLSAACWGAEAEQPGPNSNGNPQLLAAFSTVTARAGPCTVVIRCAGEQVALGTVVGGDGRVLTRAGALRGPVRCELADGRQLDAKVIGVDWARDLALLKVDAQGLESARWGEPHGLMQGDWVAAAGPGGRVEGAGIISSEPEPAGELSLQSNAVYFGVELREADGAVMVERIADDGPAATAGIRPGDHILTIKRAPIESIAAFRRAAGRLHADQAVKVGVGRGVEHLTVQVTVTNPPRPARKVKGVARPGGKDVAPLLLRHDLQLQTADLGGPLVDLSGAVIGINVASVATRNYALPADGVRTLLNDPGSELLAPLDNASVGLLRRQ